jgi:hypothetical protein
MDVANDRECQRRGAKGDLKAADHKSGLPRRQWVSSD